MDGKWYPTQILIFLWGYIGVRCVGEICAYITQLNFRKWKMLVTIPRTRYSGDVLWYVIGHTWIKLATCRTGWPQQVIGKLQLCNKGWEINLIFMTRDSTKPFDMHICPRMLHLNYLNHTIIIESSWWEFCNIVQRIDCIWYLGKLAFNLITWPIILAKAWSCIASRHTRDHHIDASINSMKYLNVLDNGWIGPQLSPWIHSRNFSSFVCILTSKVSSFVTMI
jgi:hypothetical protein